MPAGLTNSPTLIALANQLMANPPRSMPGQPATPNVAAPLHYNPQGMTPYGMTAMGMVGPWWQAAQRQFTYTPQRGLTMPNTAPGNFTATGGTGGSTGTGQPAFPGGSVPGLPVPLPTPGGPFHGNASGGDLSQKFLPGPGHNQHMKPIQPPISPNLQGTGFGGSATPNSPFGNMVGSLADATTGAPQALNAPGAIDSPAYTAGIAGIRGADVLGPPKAPVYINGQQVAGTGDQNNTAPVNGGLINPTTGEYDPRGWEPVPGQQLGTAPGAPIKYRPRGG
jgi:hypothetical protein